MNDISEKATGFIHDLGDAARQNPLSAALIGMGVLWLFTNARTAERVGGAARRGFDRTPGVARDASDAARSTVRSGADSMGSRAASATDALREGGADVLNNATRLSREYAETASDYVSAAMPGSGAEMLDTFRSNLTEVFRAQPIALGAIGLAIGAGIAAALPPTEVEATYLGETSDAVKAKATKFASEQTDQATKVAGAVIGAVREEARRQGLTMKDAKSAVGDISAKIVRVADAAGKGVSQRSTPKPS